MLTDITSVIGRFTTVLPEIANDPANKIVLATESSHLNRHLKIILGGSSNTKLLEEYVPVLNNTVIRLNSLVDTLEADSLLGIVEIQSLNDLYIFNRLREKSREEISGMLTLLVAPPSSLTAVERVSLHYSLLESGIPVGLGIGIVGWIKLILVVLLVLLLIIGLFKPALIPAVTALAQILAVIDGVGTAPKGGTVAPSGGGPVPPPPPPPPPGYGMIAKPDGTIIYLPPGTHVNPDGSYTIPPISPPPKTHGTSLTAWQEYWKECEKHFFSIGKGDTLEVIYDHGSSPPGQPNPEIEWEKDGILQPPLKPSDTTKKLSGPLTLMFHTKGVQNSGANVIIATT